MSVSASGLNDGEEGKEVELVKHPFYSPLIRQRQVSIIALWYSHCPCSVCAAAVLAALILVSSLGAGTPSSYLITALKQTNICLAAGLDLAAASSLQTPPS